MIHFPPTAVELIREKDQLFSLSLQDFEVVLLLVF